MTCFLVLGSDVSCCKVKSSFLCANLLLLGTKTPPCSCLAFTSVADYPCLKLCAGMVSEGGALKTVVVKDLTGLSEMWDQCPQTRAKLRKFERIVLEKPQGSQEPEKTVSAVAKTTDNVRFNAAELSPLLKKMRVSRSCVPCIDALQLEILKLHQSHGLQPCESVLRDEAWSLRYLLGKVKDVSYRSSPPRDSVMRSLLEDFGVDMDKWKQSSLKDCHTRVPVNNLVCCFSAFWSPQSFVRTSPVVILLLPFVLQLSVNAVAPGGEVISLRFLQPIFCGHFIAAICP